MWEKNPEPRLEPPEAYVVARCSLCTGEIYEGEFWGHADVAACCEECIDSLARTQWAAFTVFERFERFGFVLQ